MGYTASANSRIEQGINKGMNNNDIIHSIIYDREDFGHDVSQILVYTKGTNERVMKIARSLAEIDSRVKFV
ncbi:hypothetical protein V4V35_23575 [Bacillus infantis]|uniref:hypothetical protein n=1 Tax=Bacillus infantis TaxID=324767 RepID=UPI002FBE4B1B